MSEIDSCQPDYGSVLDFLAGKMSGTPSIPDEYQKNILNQASSNIEEIFKGRGNNSFNKEGFENLVMTIWTNMESTRGGMIGRNQLVRARAPTTGALVARTQANRRLVKSDFVALVMFLTAIFLGYLAYMEFCRLIHTVTGDSNLSEFSETFRMSLNNAVEQSETFSGYTSITFFNFIISVFTLTAGTLTAEILSRHLGRLQDILATALSTGKRDMLKTCIPEDKSIIARAQALFTAKATTTCMLDSSIDSAKAAYNQLELHTSRLRTKATASVNSIHELISYTCYLGYPSGSWLFFRITTGFDVNRLPEILGPSAAQAIENTPERDPMQRTLTQMWRVDKGGKKSKKYNRKTKRTRRHKKYTKKRKTRMRR
jgi:hypothetical protein